MSKRTADIAILVRQIGGCRDGSIASARCFPIHLACRDHDAVLSNYCHFVDKWQCEVFDVEGGASRCRNWRNLCLD